ncbi:hypothetical protein P9112_002212 [Eukaryota sp. TZLM1-RC]
MRSSRTAVAPVGFNQFASVSLQSTWTNYLRPAIYSIFECKTSTLSFEELYRHVYNLVNSNKASSLYEHLQSEMHIYITSLSQSLALSADTDFLDNLVNHFNQYIKAAGLISDIFMYLDRAYISSKPNLDSIKNLCIHAFISVIFPATNSPVKDRLVSLLLSSFTKARNQRIPPSDLPSSVKNAVSMLMYLGLGERSVYLAVFEGALLNDTINYYSNYASQRLASLSLSDYLSDVTDCLTFEESLVSFIVDFQGGKAARETAHSVLIESHIDHIMVAEAGPQLWIKSPHDYERPLRLLFDLISVTDVGIDALSHLLSNWLSENLLRLRQQLAIQSDTFYIEFTRSLIELYSDTIDLVVNDYFKSFTPLKRTTLDVFDQELNKTINNQDCSTIAHAIARHTDFLLRSGLNGKDDPEINRILAEELNIFKLLRSKDVYETCFQHSLAKRLLKNKSLSLELEKAMVAKLRLEIGQGTQPFEDMIRDLETNFDLQSNYTSFCTSSMLEPPIISAYVLTYGRWPFTIPKLNLVLPPTIQDSFSHFVQWYLSKHQTRRLVLNPGWSNVELGFQVAGREYSVISSLFQALVLLCFTHERHILSGAQITDLTGIPRDDVVDVLYSLCKDNRLLVRRPSDKDNKNHWSEMDEFMVNSKFVSKYVRIILRQDTQRIKAKEHHKVSDQVEKDRNQLIDAAVVRIMKSNQVVSFHDLVEKVQSDLRVHFSPSSNLLKQRIESLIERDFLERTDRTDVFKYVA